MLEADDRGVGPPAWPTPIPTHRMSRGGTKWTAFWNRANEGQTV